MAQEIVFNTRVNTGSTAKDLEPIEAQMKKTASAADDLKKSTFDVNASFDEVYAGVKPLTNQIGELEDRMYQLRVENKANTDEYKALEAQVVEYRKIIISTDRAVDQLAEQGRGLGAALQVGNTVVAGYQAVEASTAILGIENENLMETMVKLQAAQGLLNSLEQIKIALDKQSIVVTKAKQAATFVMTTTQTLYTAATTGATVATRILSAAMLAIPIVAIIAGIVALVYALDKFINSTKTAEDENNKLTASYERQQTVLDRLSSKRSAQIQDEIALLRAKGASADQIHEAELRQIKQAEQQRNEALELELKLMNERSIQHKKALEEGELDLAISIQEEIKAHKDKFKELANDEGKYRRQREILQANFDKEQADRQRQEQQEANQKAKEYRQKRQDEEEKARQLKLERERLYKDYYIASIEDEGVRSIVQLQENHKREREELISKFGQDTELLKELTAKQDLELRTLNENLAKQEREAKEAQDLKAEEARQKLVDTQLKDRRAQIEGELIMMREDFEMQQELRAELFELELEQALAQKDLTEGEKFKIQQEYNQKIQDLAEETKEKEIQERREAIDAAVSITEQGLGAIQSLSDAVFAIRANRLEKGSAAEERAAKKQFQINKSLQLASAIMSGFQAVQSALAQPTLVPAPFGTALKAASVISAGISSAANVAKIAASKYQSSASSASSASVSPPSVPGVNVPLTIPEDTTTVTSNLPGSGNNNNTYNGGASKVYLTDSDIKGKLVSMEKVQVIATVG